MISWTLRSSQAGCSPPLSQRIEMEAVTSIFQGATKDSCGEWRKNCLHFQLARHLHFNPRISLLAQAFSFTVVFFCFQLVKVYLFESQNYREIFQPLIDFSNGHNGWGLGQTKARRQVSGGAVLHVSSEVHELWLCSTAFPSLLARRWIESGSSGTQAGTHIECQHCRLRLNPFCHNASSTLLFYLDYFPPQT